MPQENTTTTRTELEATLGHTRLEYEEVRRKYLAERDAYWEADNAATSLADAIATLGGIILSLKNAIQLQRWHGSNTEALERCLSNARRIHGDLLNALAELVAQVKDAVDRASHSTETRREELMRALNAATKALREHPAEPAAPPEKSDS